MASSNRLCNATPFALEWNFHAGQEISLEPDGFVELTDPIMCEQIRPGAPGAEPVRDELEEMGIFVRDPSLPYEVQAMEALEKCIALRDRRYKDAVARSRQLLVQGNALNDESLAEHLNQQGYGVFKERLDALKSRLEKYKKLVDPALMKRAKRQQYDPERTIFVLDPPREFESKIQMAIFLEENPEIQDQHDHYMAALEAKQAARAAAEKKAPRKAASTEGE